MKFFIASFFVVFQLHFLFAQKKENQSSIKYTFHHITTEVKFLNNNTTRIFKYQGEIAPVKNSLVVLNNDDVSIKTSVQQIDNQIIIQSSALKIELNKSNGIIKFFDKDNNLLLSESRTTKEFQKIDDSVTHVSQAYSLSADEAIYGLGQHQTGRMNQRNQTILLRQRNMDIAIPFLQSTKGYGIYWDNYSATIYRDSHDNMSLTSEAGKCIDYYFIAGKNADTIIDNYRKLTGSVPMFPLWSFGYIQSRERYQSQQQVVDVVKKYRDLKVPIDAVVQDWQYWGPDNHNWNSIQFDNPDYPNPTLMIDSVHQMNAKILISVWPSFGSKSKIYQELNNKNMLFNFPTYPVLNDVKVYDAFNPKARAIYWNYMNRNLFSKGIDGWWLDATEPEQEKIRESSEPDTFNTSVVRNTKTFLGNYKSYNNAFPFETVNGVYTHQRKTAASDKRVFILTRSAFAGQQRDASMVWSGDITASWHTLKDQIPAALNYSLSGMPYWNSDIGGFYSGINYPNGNKDVLYQELYIRWLQFAVFTGMMRSHGTNTPREIYQFGKPGNVAFNLIRKYIGLRYQLEPYIYSTAWNITSKNASLMRALVMDYPNDKNVYDLGSEYLFGKSVLVAPVTDSIFAKATKTLDTLSVVQEKIYLPEGEWYDYNTNKKFVGAHTISRAYTLAQMPVFVKAGSIMPLAKEAQYSAIQNFKILTIKIYPGKDATFDLYEDEGDNYNYEKGKYSIIKFQWDDKTKTLTIDNRKGNFKSMLKNRIFKINVIGLDEIKNVEYNGNRKVIHF